MKSDDELHMELPDGFADALSRRHRGALHTEKEINLCKIKLDKLYKKYNKNKVKWDEIDWDTIENYFKEPIWYNAHTKRARYEKNMKDAHRDMFYILTNFDGNGTESFCKYNSISADDIMDDFTKYLEGI